MFSSLGPPSQCLQLLVPAGKGEQLQLRAVCTAWEMVVSYAVYLMMLSLASAGRHRARNRPAPCCCTGPARPTSAAVAGFRSGGVGPTSLWREWCRTTTCRRTAFMRLPSATVVKVGTDVGGEVLFPLTVSLMLGIATQIVAWRALSIVSM